MEVEVKHHVVQALQTPTLVRQARQHVQHVIQESTVLLVQLSVQRVLMVKNLMVVKQVVKTVQQEITSQCHIPHVSLVLQVRVLSTIINTILENLSKQIKDEIFNFKLFLLEIILLYKAFQHVFLLTDTFALFNKQIIGTE